MAEFMNVGKIVNTHGIRGELKIMPLTDFPEVRFAKNAELFLLRRIIIPCWLMWNLHVCIKICTSLI